MPPTVPVLFALRSLAACLAYARQHVEDVVYRNRRGKPTGSRLRGLQERIVALRTAERDIGAWLAEQPKGEARADVVGLLCVWAQGHSEALGELEDLLAEVAPDRAALLETVHGEDVVAGAQVAFGRQPKS